MLRLSGFGEISSTDPVSLNRYFWYATLAVFGLYFLYIILVIVAQKAYFPYVYLYVIISCGVITSILTVIELLTFGSVLPVDSAANIYSHLMFFLTWLFLFEPARQINNLRRAAFQLHTQSSSPSDERISAWKFSQYTSSGVGIVILCGYFLAFLLLILDLVSIIIINIGVADESTFVIALIVLYGPWLFALMWFFLAASHWNDLQHKVSYTFYGFFTICIQLGITLIGYPGVFEYYDVSSLYGPVLVDFILIRLTHFAAIFVGIIYGSRWLPLQKYDVDSSHK